MLPSSQVLVGIAVIYLQYSAADKSERCTTGHCVSSMAWTTKLVRREEGTHEQGPDGSSWRLFYEMENKTVSPWHDIPLRADEFQASVGPDALYHFVCEIPRGTTAKMEIHKSLPHNPITQDTKKGQLRFYKYHPEIGSICNYGALPQTWEDPEFKHPDTQVGGDNDPIDVLQINRVPCQVGQVYRVRVLGTLALLDDDETDWKVIVVDAEDPDTASMRNIQDVPKAQVDELREWFRNYKTAEGKGRNRFGLQERAMPREYAQKVIAETHKSWKQLVKTKERHCTFKQTSCWTPQLE